MVRSSGRRVAHRERERVATGKLNSLPRGISTLWRAAMGNGASVVSVIGHGIDVRTSFRARDRGAVVGPIKAQHGRRFLTPNSVILPWRHTSFVIKRRSMTDDEDF